jgi:hypothetical protein
LTAGLGLLLGFAILTEYTAALAAVPVLLYLFTSGAIEPRRRLSRASIAALLLGFALPLAL